MTGYPAQGIQAAALALMVAAGLLLGAAMAQETKQAQEPAGQQDAGPEGAAGERADGEDAAVADAAADSDLDDSDLDDQTYESDDDIFVPSEEVPADEAIPFPSDI